MSQVKFKVRQGKYTIFVPIYMEEEGNRIIFRDCFKVKDEIKAMAGSRWDKKEQYWSVTNNKRNWWQIAFLMGQNPYEWYDQPLIDYDPPSRSCYRCRGRGCELCDNGYINHFIHQKEMIRHCITRKGCICAVDMGLGKTLSAIEVMEYAALNENKKKWLYVAPRSALASVQLEWIRWQGKIRPDFVTYETLKKITHSDYDAVVFDEASRVKTPTAQRTQAAMIIAEQLREKNDHPYIILMSGTPAPKSPADWFSLCEICAPGFIKEGTIEKFKQRLGMIEMKESTLTRGIYPELITWKDDENKCAECGKYESDIEHTVCANKFHIFKKSVNEVDKLYRRMKGLVLIKRKSQCLDIPDKRYEIIKLEPNQAVLNAYEIIKAKSERTIQALTLCRELADGFQYQEIDEGERFCPLCNGIGVIDAAIAPNLCPYCEEPINGMICEGCGNYVDDQEKGEGLTDCPNCKGKKKVPKKVRKAIEVETPKIDVVKDLLDQHIDVGRMVIYAGFAGSIDRLKKIASGEGWQYIKVDGRGWESSIPGLKSDVDKISAFQNEVAKYDKLCFIAHPQSGGMGLTLTASPSILYYSNDFNYESRAQSEDRIHRPGMDVNRGATIYDIDYLPVDNYVRENLLKKKRLQDMSLGELIK